MIYLDNAATTFQKPESVYRALDEANRHYSINAGRGSYALAKGAAARIDKTRELVKMVLEAPKAAEVVFTASATLAFNAIMGGFPWGKEDVVYVSPYEHNAVMRTLYAHSRCHGFRIEVIPLTGEYGVDLPRLRFLFSSQPPAYLFVNMVSNVTGYVLPWEEICQMAAEYECITVLDAAQAFGCVPFRLGKAPVDFLVFAGHKALCGPFGAGGYVWTRRSRFTWKPALYGGTGSNSLQLEMPEDISGLEPGSPDIVAITGLKAALEEIREERLREAIWKKENEQICGFLERLAQIPGIHIYAAPEKTCQAGIVSLNLSGYLASDIGLLLDEDYEIAVRTGYHCAPLIHEYLQDQEFAGTVRVSIGRFTEKAELDRLEHALLKLAEEEGL